MTDRRRTGRRSNCPISVALELVGDAWSLLIVRDVLFRDVHTFQGFQESGEGIASNVLADRLSRLEAAGILTKRRDRDDGRRFVYELTAKGVELAPLLVEMVLWSARHEQTDAPPAVLRAMKRDRAAFLRQLRADWAARTRE